MTEEAKRPRLQQNSGTQPPTWPTPVPVGTEIGVYQGHTSMARLEETRCLHNIAAGGLQRWQTLKRSRRQRQSS